MKMHLSYTTDVFTGGNKYGTSRLNLNKGFKAGGLNARNIREKIEMMYLCSKWKVYITKSGKRLKYRLQFITLTLSKDQIHEDKWITKNLLDRFLTNLRNVYFVRNYVWVAEKQQNGNIHYHIITDSNLSYWTVLLLWNRIQERNGYHKKIVKGKGNIFDTLSNSIDVRRVGSIRKVKYYLSKYVTKTSECYTGSFKESGSHSEYCNNIKLTERLNFREKKVVVNSSSEVEVKEKREKVKGLKRMMIWRSTVKSRISGNSTNLSNGNLKEFQECGEVAEEFYNHTPEEDKERIDYGYMYKISLFKLARISKKFGEWLMLRMKKFDIWQSETRENQWREDQLILMYG